MRNRSQYLLIPMLLVGLVGLLGCPQSGQDTASTVERLKRQKAKSEQERSVDGLDSSPQDNDERKTTSQSLTKTAVDCFERSEFDNAVKLLRRALILDEKNWMAIYVLSRCQQANQELDAAVESLSQIPKDDPELGIAAQGQKADILSRLGKFEESNQILQELLQQKPELIEAKTTLARNYFLQGRRLESANVINELVDRQIASAAQLSQLVNISNPPSSVARRRPNRQLNSPGSDPLRSSDDLLSQVWDTIQMRRYRKGREMLRKIPKPRPMQAMVLDAWLSTELMDFDDATMQIEQLPEEAHAFPSYWLAVGAIYQAEEKLAEATAAFIQAFRLDATNEIAHYRLSAALMARGNTKAARNIDDHRIALQGPAEAAVDIGPSKRSDLRNLQTMVDDLEKLGFPDQAANWILEAQSRYRTAFGGPEDAAKKIRDLFAKSQTEIEAIWFSEIDLSSLPKPAAKFSNRKIAPKLAVESNGDASSKSDKSNKSARPENNFGSTGDVDRANTTPVVLAESAAETKLDFSHFNSDRPKSRLTRLFAQMGSGACAVDYDLDGKPDVYFAQAGCKPPEQKLSSISDQLFRYVDGQFSDITKSAGIEEYRYSLGVTYGDWNQDGFWDVAVGNLGPNQLWINQGDGTFRNESHRLSESSSRWNELDMTMTLAIADVDSDTFPDLVEVNYVDDEAVFNPVKTTREGNVFEYVGPNRFQAGIDRIAFSDAKGNAIYQPLIESGRKKRRLTDSAVTQMLADSRSSRIGDAAYPGLGMVIDDLDPRPGLEIFVANDARPNQYWKVDSNTEEGRMLRESAALNGLATSGTGLSTACMGIAVTDIDRDGRQDMVVTNFRKEWSNLYLQKKPGLFRDVAPAYQLDQLSENYVGFGIIPVDLDNDGAFELVVGNGHLEDYTHLGIPQKMPTQVFRNDGRRLYELDMTAGNDPFWMKGQLSRCLVQGDFDQDGFVDVIVTQLAGSVAYLQNETSTENRWIKIDLVARSGERSAVGSRVRVFDFQPRLSQSLGATSGYMGRGESTLHFGLGQWDSPTVDIEVSWGHGGTETFRGLSVDDRHTVIEGLGNKNISGPR